ncbi:MAG: hypothetical protein HC915_02675 [Anaerolineae bacterium]|nr:hypothetical protein [Anaerolineae bacterium]
MHKRLDAYRAIAALAPKHYLAYQVWVWTDWFTSAIGMTIMLFFWRGIYANSPTVAGLDFNQTITYILLAQILVGVTYSSLILNAGYMIREGMIAIELLRPVDFQAQRYTYALAELGVALLVRLPILGLALLYGLRLPSDPLAWGCFAVSLLLGQSILFMFEWLLAALCFYTTEVWGLYMLNYGLMLFLSGSVLPLVMLPDAVEIIVRNLPYAQALFVPLSFLSGITPVQDAPQVWLQQAIWLVGLWALSRWVFRTAARKITVQGG